MTLSERINVRYIRHENGYSRIKYDLMCECGCDSDPFMLVVYPPENKDGKLTKEQAKKLIIKRHEV